MRTRDVFVFFILIMVVLASAVLGAYVGGTAVSMQYEQKLQELEVPKLPLISETQPASSTQSLVISSTDIQTRITEIVEQIEPAVVTVVGKISGYQTFFGRAVEQQVEVEYYRGQNPTVVIVKLAEAQPR